MGLHLARWLTGVVGGRYGHVFLSMNKEAVIRNGNMDAIRLFAAILVVFSHCYPLLGRGQDPIVRMIGVSGGELAVSIFFVLSGYLITGSYLRSRSVPLCHTTSPLS